MLRQRPDQLGVKFATDTPRFLRSPFLPEERSLPEFAPLDLSQFRQDERFQK
jgi:hypothetical protein